MRLVGVFLRRDLTIARSYRFPFLIELITSGGILLAVHQISGLVDPGRSSDPNLRAGFFSYVLVGMAVLQFVQAALGAFTGKLREEQVTGTFEAMLTTPASPPGLALSLAAYPVVQGIASSLVLLGAGAALGARFAASLSGIVTSLICFAGLVALSMAIGIAVAAFTVVFKRGGSVAGLVGAAVALFAGVFFPVAQLPPWIRWAGAAMPFNWGISALRSSLLFGSTDYARTGGLLAAAVLGLPLALVIFRRSVDRARRQGTLGQY